MSNRSLMFETQHKKHTKYKLLYNYQSIFVVIGEPIGYDFQVFDH